MSNKYNKLARYALTFAVGMVVGFGLLWALGGNDSLDGTLDIGGLTGAMMSAKPTDAFEEISSVKIDLGRVYGDVRLHEANRELVAEVSLSSLDEIKWKLMYDRDEVSFDGFSQVEGRMGNIETKGGELNVSQVGRGRYMVFFMGQVDDPEPLKIEISMAGDVVYENRLAGNTDR
jgi:hypothetical protein